MGGVSADTEADVKHIVSEVLRENSAWSEFKIERVAEEIYEELYAHLKEDM